MGITWLGLYVPGRKSVLHFGFSLHPKHFSPLDCMPALLFCTHKVMQLCQQSMAGSHRYAAQTANSLENSTFPISPLCRWGTASDFCRESLLCLTITCPCKAGRLERTRYQESKMSALPHFKSYVIVLAAEKLQQKSKGKVADRNCLYFLLLFLLLHRTEKLERRNSRKYCKVF